MVVHRAHGFRFVIYTQDHLPDHVHITGPGHAKVDLLGPGRQPRLVSSAGIKRSVMKKLVTEVVEHQVAFLAEWERSHGPLD